MKKKEMKWNYIKCEREMIDFCLDKLKEYNVREYYEDGSYKPTNADKLLDWSLKLMIDGKSALQYVYIKHIVEFLIQNGYKVKGKNFQKDDIAFRIFGMVDSEGESLEEYVKKVNYREYIEEPDRYMGAPFICIPRSMYNKVRERLENINNEFQIRTLNTSLEEGYIWRFIPKDDLYSKEYAFWTEDEMNDNFRENAMHITNSVIIELIDD